MVDLRKTNVDNKVTYLPHAPWENIAKSFVSSDPTAGEIRHWDKVLTLEEALKLETKILKLSKSLRVLLGAAWQANSLAFQKPGHTPISHAENM